jgi:leader peptidase (prepilin peptidase) / N-methyltransferase
MDDPIVLPHPIVSHLLETFWYPIVFLYGAVVGSFLNVLIYRLPLILVERDEIARSEDETARNRQPSLTIGGKSFCPRCKSLLKPYHNVPLFGFLFLGGRCAFCKVRISWRYFTVELLTACLWTAVFHALNPRNPVGWCDFLFQALFVSVLIALIFIDLDHFIAPDELNVAAGVLGVGRDLACIGIAYLVGRGPGAEYFFKENAAKYLAAPWVPNAVVGALTYAAVLFLVSIGSHLYYARPPWEPVGASIKRYFTLEPMPEPPPGYEEAHPEPDAPEPAEEEGEAEEPARLRFSPGVLAILSALLLVPAIWWYASLAFVVPMVAFFALSRAPGESFAGTFRRFFSADDQAGLPDDALPLPKSSDPDEVVEEEDITAQLQAEADQFALEAETGQHGGMGMGDVKLAFGIGALLGAGLALLSLAFAAFLGAVVGVALAQRRRGNLRVAVPFVPFMAAGAIIALLFGVPLLQWYAGLYGLNKDAPAPPAATRPARP